MRIATLSGSSLQNSRNERLLKSLSSVNDKHEYVFVDIQMLPLFSVEADANPLEHVKLFKQSIASCQGVVISTPEYIHNIPAVLKNAFEWTTSSGELNQKKVLAMTFTPHPPRGEKAMESMCNSLLALDAHVLTTLALYQNEIFMEEKVDLNADSINVLREALNLF